MEVLGAGQQEPGAAAAAAAAPSEEIDLSLDDIIKRNRKPWQHQRKTQNQASGNRRGPPSLPGSSRFPQGFRKPPWARKPFGSRMSTPGPRPAGQMKGRSPLNRPALAQQDKPGKAPPGRNGNRAPADSQPEAPPRAKAFKTARTPLPFRRPFRSFNQGRAYFLQSQVKFNFNQRQIRPRMEQNLSRVRRGRMQPSSGAVLTVSVSNPQGPGLKRPFLRRRTSQTPQLRWQPRGVMLRFNFRAMANQTSMTLNERFSGLRHQRHFSAERNTSRMVTLP